MLRMTFERNLRVAPSSAWQLLTDPVQMNQWSSARIESVAYGDGGHPGAVGALRRVRLPHRGGLLTEVIDRSEPPHLLQYRVVSGAPVRHHGGTITISDDSHLRWTVEIEPYSRAFIPPIWALLQWELNRSLTRLAAIEQPVNGHEPLPRELASDQLEMPALRAVAEEVARRQGALADELLAVDDPRGYFARVYQFVTEGMLAAVDADRFDHPGWVLRLIPLFDAYFTANVRAEAADIEPHWRRAFTKMERARDGSRFDLMVNTVLAGMQAHIEDDLPRALGTVYAKHYARHCEHVRFRADYLRMTDIFPAAGDRLLATLPRWRWAPGPLLVDLLAPKPLREQLFERRIYPISRNRSRAFDQAVWIGQLITA
ncbi:MAG: DUF5995 family protein [Jatrophihabitantaceae bacterium]